MCVQSQLVVEAAFSFFIEAVELSMVLKVYHKTPFMPERAPEEDYVGMLGLHKNTKVSA